MSNLLFTYELNKRLKASGNPKNIISVAVHPGNTHTYIHTYIHTHAHNVHAYTQHPAYTHTYLNRYMHAMEFSRNICAYVSIKYIHTYINTYIRTYIHTYTHKSIHTYIHTYIYLRNTYVHTFILEHTCGMHNRGHGNESHQWGNSGFPG